MHCKSRILNNIELNRKNYFLTEKLDKKNAGRLKRKTNSSMTSSQPASCGRWTVRVNLASMDQTASSYVTSMNSAWLFWMWAVGKLLEVFSSKVSHAKTNTTDGNQSTQHGVVLFSCVHACSPYSTIKRERPAQLPVIPARHGAWFHDRRLRMKT